MQEEHKHGQDGSQRTADPKGQVERLVIYRCGWCGYPVQENGEPLPEIKDNDDAHTYLQENGLAEVKNVNGFCCPNGNEECW